MEILQKWRSLHSNVDATGTTFGAINKQNAFDWLLPPQFGICKYFNFELANNNK
jgi:hypothetical protein